MITSRRLKIRRSRRFSPILKRLGGQATYNRLCRYLDQAIARRNQQQGGQGNV